MKQQNYVPPIAEIIPVDIETTILSGKTDSIPNYSIIGSGDIAWD